MKLNFLKLKWLSLYRAALCLASLTLAGCAWLTQPPEIDPLALQLVETLNQTNIGLQQYKALSHVRLDLEEQTQSASAMAIAAQLPNRMRVEVLSPAGQPVTSLVADGDTIRIRPQGKTRVYQFRQSATALEPLLHLPIGVSELQGVLIGRPELPEYAGAEVLSHTNERIKVVLKSRWKEDLAVLEFDGEDRSIRSVEVFAEEGRSLYRAIWFQWQDFGPYRVPVKLRLESDNGYQVTLRIRRFWPDVALSDATFELGMPD